MTIGMYYDNLGVLVCFVWDEIPAPTTWIGAAVIAASGLFIFIRRQKRQLSSKTSEMVVIE